MRALRALHSAVAMYTWLPVRKHDWTDSDFPDGLVAFPWLGLALGGAAGSLGWGATAVSGSLFLGAVLALGAVAFVTGAMHLDGTADVADALGSRKPAEQARAIMKQSDIGPMGVTSLLFTLLLEVGALCAVPSHTWPLLVAAGMGAGRVTPLAATLPRRGEVAVPGTLSAGHGEGGGSGALGQPSGSAGQQRADYRVVAGLADRGLLVRCGGHRLGARRMLATASPTAPGAPERRLLWLPD